MTRLAAVKLERDREHADSTRLSNALHDLAFGLTFETRRFTADGYRYVCHLTRVRTNPVIIVIEYTGPASGNVRVHELETYRREVSNLSLSNPFRLPMLKVCDDLWAVVMRS